MNEKISRILDMLEKGTITADEAERLIRASSVEEAAGFRSEAAAAPPKHKPDSTEEERTRQDRRGFEDVWDPFSPFCDPFPGVTDVTRVFRRLRDQIARYHMRRYWWNYFRLNRWYERRRAHRRETLSVYERVRFVLLGAPPTSGFIVQPQTIIAELLERDRIAWDLFRFGLEEEFGIQLTLEQTKAFLTVQDVVDFIESHQPFTGVTEPPVETDATSAAKEESAKPAATQYEEEASNDASAEDLASPE